MPLKHPAWLTSAIDQRKAHVEAMLGDLTTIADVIVVTLTEPPPQIRREDWERMCDNCKAVCLHPVPFYTGHTHERLSTGVELLITFGVCRQCRTTLEED